MTFAQLRQPSVSVQALVLVSVVHECSDLCPSFGELVVKFYKLVVFFGGPGLHFTFGDLRVFLFDLHVQLLSIFLHEYGELSLHSSKVVIKLANRRFIYPNK